MLPSLVDHVIPVDRLGDLVNQVDDFTVGRENYDFLRLVCVQEHQQVYEPVLDRYLQVKLLHLGGDAHRGILLLLLKADCQVVFHHFGSQSFNFVGEGR